MIWIIGGVILVIGLVLFYSVALYIQHFGPKK